LFVRYPDQSQFLLTNFNIIFNNLGSYVDRIAQWKKTPSSLPFPRLTLFPPVTLRRTAYVCPDPNLPKAVLETLALMKHQHPHAKADMIADSCCKII
jgi:hypothetical protein